MLTLFSICIVLPVEGIKRSSHIGIYLKRLKSTVSRVSLAALRFVAEVSLMVFCFILLPASAIVLKSLPFPSVYSHLFSVYIVSTL